MSNGPSTGVLPRPGMYVTVSIVTEVLNNRFLVPRSALLTRDQRSIVFTVKGPFAKWHYVDTGENNDEFWEIRNGIAAGDTVIVEGHYTLAHDARVSISNVLR
jgi:membrane fusion protein (multidrug efflux system)